MFPAQLFVRGGWYESATASFPFRLVNSGEPSEPKLFIIYTETPWNLYSMKYSPTENRPKYMLRPMYSENFEQLYSFKGIKLYINKYKRGNV